MRLLEAPDPAVARARERAFFMTEQLALQDLRGEGGAMNDHQFVGRASAQMMQRLGGQFLAGPAFPLDEHGRFRGRDLLDDLKHRLDGRRAA